MKKYRVRRKTVSADTILQVEHDYAKVQDQMPPKERELRTKLIERSRETKLLRRKLKRQEERIKKMEQEIRDLKDKQLRQVPTYMARVPTTTEFVLSD